MAITPKYNKLSKSFFIDGSFGQLLYFTQLCAISAQIIPLNLVRQREAKLHLEMYQLFNMTLFLDTATVVFKHLLTHNANQLNLKS
jgi:hypothetical protein